MEFYYHGTDKDILILSADGGLNSQNADYFVDQLKTLIESGVAKIIVNCDKLTYISSYGVGVLLSLHKRLAERGGEVKLANVQSKVIALLSLIKLDRVFQVYPHVDAARLAFHDRLQGKQTE